MIRHRFNDRVECAYSDRLVRRNCNPLMRRLRCLENYVTAYLMHLPVMPSSTQNLNQLGAGYVARYLHTVNKTSSRTR